MLDIDVTNTDALQDDKEHGFGWARFQQRLRDNSVLLSLTLSKKQLGTFLSIALVTMQLFQWLSFVFNAKVNFAWDREYVGWLQDLLKFVRPELFQIDSELPFTLFLAFVGITWGWFVLALISLFLQSFPKKQTAYNGATYLLWWMSTFLSSIGFLPWMSTFLASFNVPGESRSLTQALGVVTACVHLLLSICFAVCCIDQRPFGGSIEARAHSRVHVVELLGKAMLVTVFSLNTAQTGMMLWVLVCFCIAESVLVTSLYVWYIPYFNFGFNSLQSMANSVTVWASVALALCQVYNDTNFPLSAVWLFTVVPVGTISVGLVCTMRRQQLLNISLKKIRDPFSCELYIRNLIQCKADAEGTDSIDSHSTESGLSEEALKEAFDEYHEFVKAMPKSSIPNFFLLHFLSHYKYQVHLTERYDMQTEDTNPPVDILFYLWRERAVRREEMTVTSGAATSSDAGLNLLAYLEYTEHLAAAKRYAERALRNQYFVWTELLLNEVETSKLNHFALEMNSDVVLAYEHFQKVLRLSKNNPNIVRTYANFVSQVLNDRKQADTLLQRADEIENSRVHLKSAKGSAAIPEDSSTLDDDTALVIASAASSNRGVILSVNDAACTIFNKRRPEMVGCGVTTLIPPPFSAMHSKFMEEYERTLTSSIVNNTTNMFGWSQGRIFPISMRVQHFGVLGAFRNVYVSIIRKLPHPDAEHFVLFGPSGEIYACTSKFGILSNVSQNYLNACIYDYFPGLQNQIQDQQVEDETEHSFDLDLSMQTRTGEISMHGWVASFAASRIKSVRVLRLVETQSNNFANASSEPSRNVRFTESESQQSDFSGARIRIISENADERAPEPMLGDPEQMALPDVDDESTKGSVKELQSVSKDQEFKSVRAMPFTEADETRSQHSALSGASKASSFYGYMRIVDTIRARVLKGDNLESNMKKFLLTIFLALALLISTSVTAFSLVDNSTSSLQKQIERIDISAELTYYNLDAEWALRSLHLIHEGVYPAEDEAYWRVYLKKASDSLNFQSLGLYLGHQDDLSPTHKQFYENKVLTFESINAGKVTLDIWSFWEVVQMMVWATQYATGQTLDELTDSNSAAFFIRYQSPLFRKSLNDSTIMYEVTSRASADNVLSIQTALMSVSLVILLLAYVLLVRPAINQVESTRQRVFSIFSDIPVKMVKDLQEKCFNSLSDQEGLIDDQPDGFNEDKEENNLDKKNDKNEADPNDKEAPAHSRSVGNLRQRILKSQSKGNGHRREIRVNDDKRRKIMLQAGVLFVLAFTYYIAIYVFDQGRITDQVSIIAEISWSQQRYIYSRYLMYKLRDLIVSPFMNSDYRPVNAMALAEEVKTGVDLMMQIHSGLNFGNQWMRVKGSVNRHFPRDDLLYLSICHFVNTDNPNDCKTFGNGLLATALDPTIQQYASLFRSITNKVVERMTRYNDWDISFANATLHSDEYVLLSGMSDFWVKESLRIGKTQYFDELKENITSFISLRLLLLVLLVVVSCSLFFWFYVPLTYFLDRELKRVTGLMLIVPIEAIESSTALRKMIVSSKF